MPVRTPLVNVEGPRAQGQTGLKISYVTLVTVQKGSLLVIYIILRASNRVSPHAHRSRSSTSHLSQ